MIPWWTDQQAGRIGGLIGGIVGSYGGIVGAVGGHCIPRGKCKPLVYALMAFLFVLGIFALVVGIAALLQRQPYAVWFPFILTGVLCTVLPVGLFPVTRRRYQEAEIRRVEAEMRHLQAEELRRS